MPIKRGNARHRGLDTGLEKLSTIRRFKQTDNRAWERTSDQKQNAAELTLEKLAEFTFSCITYIASSLHVIPMTYDGGVCSLTTTKIHLFYHYCILLFLVARVANIFCICSQLIIEDFTIMTLLSFTVLILFLLSLSLGCSSILISQETVQLVNTWRQLLGILAQVQRREVGMFEDVTLSIKVVGVGGSVLLCPLLMSLLPLVYSELPVSMQYQTKQLFPDLPDVLAQLVCFPFEMLPWVPASLLAGFGACVLIISIDLGSSSGEFLGGCPLNTPVQYEKVIRIYSFAKIYNTILNVWYKFVTPPAFFMASASIVICLYITFRLTELPVYIYCFYPYFALVFSVVEFGLCYDGFVVIAASREIVSRLRSVETKCFSQMSEQDRAIELRRGKGLRPIIVNVGIFTAFNMWVPINLLDEILNQLVLLLKL